MPFNVIKPKDRDRKMFSKTNLAFETDPYLAYQDPTVLGFKLLFDFYRSPLLRIDGNSNSALAFLERRGHTERAQYLRTFIRHLKKINESVPWFFQTIEGLDEAWARNFDSPSVAGEIGIECLESIDLKITALLDLYRKACYDYKHKREIVPENLRKFELRIYVLETRRMQISALSSLVNSGKNTLSAINSALGNQTKDLQMFGEHGSSEQEFEKTNHIMFNFGFCEFSLESGKDTFSTISNSEPEQAKQKILIGYKTVEEENLFNILGSSKIRDDIFGTLKLASLDLIPGGHGIQDGPLSGVIDFGGEVSNLVAEKLANRGANALTDFANSKINSLLLGNIYGFSPQQNVNALQNLSQGQQTFLSGAGPSIANQTGTARGNVEDPSASKSNTTGSPNGNVFQ